MLPKFDYDGTKTR